MLSSFYGGKQGRSYHIVARYDSIYDMVQAFQQGPNNTDVAFDEYVIIDTIVNKNDKSNLENGIIYRRGYNFSEGWVHPEGYTRTKDERVAIAVHANEDQFGQRLRYYQDQPNEGQYTVVIADAPAYYDFDYIITNTGGILSATIDYDSVTFNEDYWINNWQEFVIKPGGGAIYVGQIVGPEGPVSSIELMNWQDFLDYIEEDPQGQLESEKGILHITQYPGRDDEHIHAGTEYDDQGYDPEGYLDIVQYGYCTFRDEQGNIVGSYLSFSFPYVIFSMEAHGIPAYPASGTAEDYIDSQTGVRYHFNSETRLWEYDDLIRETESLDHKYYKHYEIQIPKGVHGQNVNELKLYSDNEGTYQNPYNDDGWNLKDIAIEHDNQGNPIIDSAGNYILKPEYQHQFITYRTINFDKFGTGEISEIEAISPYRIISSLQTEIKSGYTYPERLKISYTYGDATYLDYSMIEKTWVQENNSTLERGIEGNLTHAQAIADDVPTHLLRKSHLYVLLSNEPYPRDLGLIDTIEHIWVQEGNDDQHVDVDGNTLINQHIYVQLSKDEYPTDLGFVRKLEDFWIQNEPTEELKEDFFYAQLTNESSPREVGFIRKITSITKELDDENNPQIYVNYNYNLEGEPGDRALLPVAEIDQVAFDGDLLLIRFKNIEESAFNQTYPYQGKTWINVGHVVKSTHVETNFPDLATLETTYPAGLGYTAQGEVDPATAERAGWVVTVGDDQQGYKLYAFDYLYNDATHPRGRWYNIQDLSSVVVDPKYTVLVSTANEQGVPTDPAAAQLRDGGLWFLEV